MSLRTVMKNIRYKLILNSYLIGYPLQTCMITPANWYYLTSYVLIDNFLPIRTLFPYYSFLFFLLHFSYIITSNLSLLMTSDDA